MFTRATDSSLDTGNDFLHEKEECQTAERTEQEINYRPLDVLSPKLSSKLSRTPIRSPQTLSNAQPIKPTSPGSVHLQFAATMAAARPEAEPTRTRKNIDDRNIDRQTRNAKSKKKVEKLCMEGGGAIALPI
jgi:hypothetical protein